MPTRSGKGVGLMSLPVRERGLKQRSAGAARPVDLSLPVRERGLKLYQQSSLAGLCWSLPVRERGLKPVAAPLALIRQQSLPVRERGLKHCNFIGSGNVFASLPVRERGLKPQSTRCVAKSWLVAPRAGAWIEAAKLAKTGKKAWSRSPCGSVD